VVHTRTHNVDRNVDCNVDRDVDKCLIPSCVSLILVLMLTSVATLFVVSVYKGSVTCVEPALFHECGYGREHQH